MPFSNTLRPRRPANGQLPDRQPRRARPRSFQSPDIERELTAMKDDPLFSEQRDPEFTGFVDRQFSRVFGDGAARQDATGRTVAPRPQRSDLESFQPSLRPDDTRLSESVGRTARNRPQDVLRVQRGLSNAGTFSFDVPRERSGRPSEGLFQGIEAFQRENGLQIDGVIQPLGETIVTLGRAFGLIGDRGERVLSGIDAGLNLLGSSRSGFLSGVDSALGFSGNSASARGTENTNALSARSRNGAENEDPANEGQSARCAELRELIRKERERIAELRMQIEQQKALIQSLRSDIARVEFQIEELESPPIKNFAPRGLTVPGITFGIARGTASIAAIEFQKRRLQEELEKLKESIRESEETIRRNEEEIREREERVEQFQSEIDKECVTSQRSDLPIS